MCEKHYCVNVNMLDVVPGPGHVFINDGEFQITHISFVVELYLGMQQCEWMEVHMNNGKLSFSLIGHCYMAAACNLI